MTAFNSTGRFFASVLVLLVSASCDLQQPTVVDPLDPTSPTAQDSLALAPAEVAVSTGGAATFHVPDTTVLGKPADGPVVWTVSAGSGGTVDTNGVFRSPVAGDFVVQASRGGHYGHGQVHVAPSTAAVAVRISPSSVMLPTGAAFTFTATGLKSDSSTMAISTSWSATGGTITSTGQYTAGTAPGTYLVIARQSGTSLADTASVTINAAAPTLQAVEVTPGSITLAPGGTQQFSAIGRMSDGHTSSLSVNWSTNSGTISPTGAYTAGTTAGSFRVIATQQAGTKADTASVTIAVAPPTVTLRAVVVAPGSANLTTGSVQQFSATGSMSDGSTSSVAVTWSSTGGSVNSSGAYTAGSVAGTFRVIATQQGGTLADTASVVLTAPAPTLQHVVLSPGTVTLAPGATQQFSTAGQMSDGSTSAVATTYAATGGSVNTSGFYTAGTTAGSYRVIAVQQGGTLADTSTITITSPGLTYTGVEISPATVSMATNSTKQFSADGRMSNGGTAAINVTWTATGGSVSSAGLYSAGSAAGSFIVIATQQGGTLADTAVVTLTASSPTLSAIVVSPGTATVATGGTQQFTASGTMSDNSSQPVAVTWAATGGTISSAGLYTAGTTAGAFRVIATQQGGTKADTALVTLAASAPTLSAVVMTPASATLTTGATQQFTAVGTMSDNSTQPVSVTWAATGGTISSAGLYTAGSSAGAFRVIATQQGGSKADTAAVTLSAPAPTLSAVVMTPAAATLAAGATQQFTAVGRMSDNSTQPVSVNWSATGGTISGTGLYTAGTTAGTAYRVIAVQQGGTKADTSTVTVTASTGGARTYSTNFALSENPISEGGHWINGASVGLDWNNVSTTPGLAIGRQASASYTDGTAVLDGTWGSNQSVTAKVYAVNPKDACYQEVELRLRSTVAAHLNNGYEISFKSSQSSDAYLIIVRWNGPLGNYTYLFNQSGAQYGVKTGDVISAKVVGNTITAYKNGVQMASATDNTYTGGSPGMGFNLENAPAGCSGTNGDYGYTSFSATDAP